MKNILPGALALSVLFAAPASAAEQVVRLEVGGLTCPSCSFIVGNSLKSVESVVIEDFVEGKDASEGVYTVRFDDEITSTDALIAAVEKNGYPAALLEGPMGGEGS
ncbi:mercuric ion binding protein [Devosia subaequoris]|uniref:Mercuric ion binding protein n=1 Tax=Devosia subaequoris TaxID=395930 RepID=A0A7W6IQP8_9HYPH|nr:mercuric transport protein periplasmic component [Devosia subaequoris]MBB4054053.1 mercuric ion binding protein [Devosia subaequoris]MCP1211594.1 mercuric transport protein periplasmic component [Devosia subaequoris]